MFGFRPKDIREFSLAEFDTYAAEIDVMRQR